MYVNACYVQSTKSKPKRCIYTTRNTDKKNTVELEPPNKGQVGTSTVVHYLEVVLYWGVFAKILYFTFYDILGRILLQCGYKAVCVRTRKIL